MIALVVKAGFQRNLTGIEILTKRRQEAPAAAFPKRVYSWNSGSLGDKSLWNLRWFTDF